MSEAPITGAAAKVRSLYVHVPFCAHRCGYCDFVTTSRSPELHDRYVYALKRELEIRHPRNDGYQFDTIFVGGGTPTLLDRPAMQELLDWLGAMRAPQCELTIECNPETVTPELAKQLVDGGVSRVSLGAQSFDSRVLEVLERRADPDTVRGAVAMLREAGVKRLSLDIIWGVPGQSAADARTDIERALALNPDHVSAYELEFKPGTRLAHTHGVDAADLVVGEAGEECYDAVIDTFEDAGWWWYETANFARSAEERCRHNLAYWHADDWLGVGVGAVETVGAVDGAKLRRSNLPNLPRYLAAIENSEAPPARNEEVDARTVRVERIMLALRLDEVVHISAADISDEIVDSAGIERLVEHDLARVDPRIDADGVMRGGVSIRLNRHGRMLQASVAQMLLDLDAL